MKVCFVYGLILVLVNYSNPHVFVVSCIDMEGKIFLNAYKNIYLNFKNTFSKIYFFLVVFFAILASVAIVQLFSHSRRPPEA